MVGGQAACACYGRGLSTNETGTTNLAAVLKSPWVRVIARYVLGPILAGLMAALLASRLEAAFPRADIGFTLAMLTPGGALAAWVVAVVSDRRRQAWRIWGPWAPCAPLLLLLIFVMKISGDVWPRDDTGFAMLVCFAVLQLAAVLAVLGSVAALVYRPGQRPT